MTQPDPYMDTKALAEYCRLNRKKVRALVKDMPHFQPGRKFLVKRSVFDAHMKRFLVNAHPLVDQIMNELRTS